MKIQQLDKIQPGFAALDLGAAHLHAATADAPVKVFGTTTSELRHLIAWLREHGVQHVAFEATGVYWIPVHDQLQHAGFDVLLFHGRMPATCPAKKSDFADCQWHGVLISHGLLRACFIPAEEVRALRTYARLRDDHLEQAAMSAQFYYLAITKGLAYVEQGLVDYEAHCRAQEQHRLRKFAARMGSDLVPNTPC